MGEQAATVRLSARELARICEHHRHAMADLYPFLLASESELSHLLQTAEWRDGIPSDAASRSQRLAQSFVDLTRRRGWRLDDAMSMTDLVGGSGAAAALALVVHPLVEAFGANVTTSAGEPRCAGLGPPPSSTVRSIALRNQAPPIDFRGLAARVTVDSAKLRHYALLISGQPALGPRGKAVPVPEDVQWRQVGELLFQLWSKEGRASFFSDHGDAGRLFVQEVERLQSTAMPEPPNWDGMATLVSSIFRAHATGARGLIDDLVRCDEVLPRRIPELDLVKAATPADAYRGVGIIGIQHLLPSIVPLFEAFIEHGAEPSKIWVLAKDYTNNPLVIAYLRTLGVHVMDATEEVDGTYNVIASRQHDIQMFTRSAEPELTASEATLVLDDGAMLIEHLNRTSDERCYAVELTTKGHLRLQKLDLNFPALSIARAPNKIDEGEVIGLDLANGLLREHHWAEGAGPLGSVLAVGLGTVGSNFLAEAHRRGFRARGFDADPHRRDAVAAKVPAAQIVSKLDPSLVDVRRAVLMTGTGPFDSTPFVVGRVQVGSGSSEAVELDENAFYEKGFFEAPLNGMRPLNFVRNGHETLSHREIGLTRATFFSACTQVLAETEKGTRELEPTEALNDAAALWKSEGRRRRRPEPSRRPTPPRAHAGTYPTHSEWMRFFLEGAMSDDAPVMVRPAPSAVNFAPQVYLFFHEGAWHGVDTREGRSHRLELSEEWNDARTQLLTLADSGPWSVALVRPTETGSQVRVIEPSWRPSTPLFLGTPVGVSTRRIDIVGAEPAAEFFWFFESDREIQLVSGGNPPRIHRVARVDLAPSTYALVGADTLLQVTAEPSIYLHSLDGDVRQLTNHGFGQVVGVSQPSNRPNESHDVFIIGREPSGTVAIVRIDANLAMGRVALPPNAAYREIDAFASGEPTVVFEHEGAIHRLEIPLATG